jgi:hypothetical protein
MPRFRIQQAFIASVVLSCLAWSGAPQSFEAPEPPGSSRAKQEREGSTIRTVAQRGSDQTRVREAYGKLPLSFEPNRGQTDPQVKFLSRGPGYTLFLTATDAVLSLEGPRTSIANQRTESNPVRSVARAPKVTSQHTAVRMRVVGANARARVFGREQLPGNVNYFHGNDPTRWRTGIPTYAQVNYDDVYPGIDLVYYGNQRQLEYDFIVAPGADPRAIALTFEGADGLKVDAEGNLLLQIGDAQLTQRAPYIYQEIGGVKESVAGRFSVSEARTGSHPSSRLAASDAHVVRFDVGPYDTRRPLVIDPVLAYSTYLGGTLRDEGFAIAVGDDGSAYVTGSTTSSSFPTTPGAFDTTANGGSDAFVTKLNADGATLVYSTYLGGGNDDVGYGIALDSAGNAYVTGFTASNGFPTTAGAFDRTRGGPYDGFVTKLSADGQALVYSTFLGGNQTLAQEERGSGIAVDGTGSAYVTGVTPSSDFPTTPGAFDTTHNGNYDAFLTKIAPTGATLDYSSYLGGTSVDRAHGIAVDATGNAYVTGLTQSSDYPTTPGAFDTTHNLHADAFVAKVQANGAALAYSTYLGGFASDFGYGIAVDNTGIAYVTGATFSSNFPTTPGAFDTTLGGNASVSDAFVTKLAASGASLAYSTFLGGANSDQSHAIAVDDSGAASVVGSTNSDDFPTTPGAFDTTFGGGIFDAFVTTLESTGAALAYSTYLGAGGHEEAFGVAIDISGSAYVTGYTESGFPTTPGAYDTTYGGGTFDGFVAKFEQDPGEPDLVVTAVSNPPAVLLLKQKFSVTDSTHNQGSDAVATTTRYYLSRDAVKDAGDKLLSGKRAVPALAAGATSTGTVNVTVPKSTKLGVYRLLACADDLKVQAEDDETNNCRASTTTVEVRAPDLIESAISNPPATASPGGSFSVTDTALNQGNAAAGASTTRYRLSLDTKKSASDPLLTGTRSVPALGVGASSTGSVTVTIPAATAPGTYFLLACADDLKKAFESNEKNNCKASATRVTVSP